MVQCLTVDRDMGESLGSITGLTMADMRNLDCRLRRLTLYSWQWSIGEMKHVPVAVGQKVSLMRQEGLFQEVEMTGECVEMPSHKSSDSGLRYIETSPIYLPVVVFSDNAEFDWLTVPEAEIRDRPFSKSEVLDDEVTSPAQK